MLMSVNCELLSCVDVSKVLAVVLCRCQQSASCCHVLVLVKCEMLSFMCVSKVRVVVMYRWKSSIGCNQVLPFVVIF